VIAADRNDRHREDDPHGRGALGGVSSVSLLRICNGPHAERGRPIVALD
jgi:hypothetical protein